MWEGADDENPTSVDPESSTLEFDPEELAKIQSSLDWLENNEEPWEIALYHWRVTSPYRRKQIGGKL